MRRQDEFLAYSNKMAFDTGHRELMQTHRLKYSQGLANAQQQFANLELARNRAAYAKWKVTENLDKYLIEFESNVIKRGGKVLWADDAAGAVSEIETIVKKHENLPVLKSRSTVADEIGLTRHLRSKGISVSEISTGDYIIDQQGELPYHYTRPALHKTLHQVNQLLNDRISSSLDASPAELSSDIRNELRPLMRNPAIGITGATFLAADSGLAGISENDGSSLLCLSVPKVQILLAGIESVIPSINDAELFFSLYSTYASTQKLNALNILAGPRTPDDPDGPSEFYVILIDNGRSNVLAHQEQREAMGCIKCGACLNECPVYNTIGGYAYGSTGIGPIGQVTAPLQFGLDEFRHLSFANPLNKYNSKVCPVKIDIDNHLLRNRKESVQQGLIKNGEKLMWYSWKKFMLSRKNMNKSASIKGFMLKSFFKSTWGERREFPRLADKSFNQLWRERSGQ